MEWSGVECATCPTVASLCEAHPSKKAKIQMSSENLTDQFASAVMTGSINEGDIARAGANGACDATRRESRNPAGNRITSIRF